MDDALQEAYLKAYKGLHRFRAGSDFGTWLYRITYNACIDELRKRKRAPVSTVDPVDPSPAGRARSASSARRRRCAARWRSCPSTSGSRSSSSTARGSTTARRPRSSAWRPGTVASRLHRARAALRRILGEEVR